MLKYYLCPLPESLSAHFLLRDRQNIPHAFRLFRFRLLPYPLPIQRYARHYQSDCRKRDIHANAPKRYSSTAVKRHAGLPQLYRRRQSKQFHVRKWFYLCCRCGRTRFTVPLSSHSCRAWLRVFAYPNLRKCSPFLSDLTVRLLPCRSLRLSGQQRCRRLSRM